MLDRRGRVLSFAPGSIFAFVRWTSNDFGTAISRIDILHAVAPGQRCSTVNKVVHYVVSRFPVVGADRAVINYNQTPSK
ncbi:DUF2840 domain-containing protein [Bradyrhizobium sp. CNPSo 4019]|uniref:DUF2840 domain-containing protein n=1 Tax=Bradyrhizobium diversitatis TaxID=2755406 RepID=A0ABS0PG00_9BRAD|nr:DUF2840 domain-containing protein [Bradyrhizobium diversitatis]